MISNMLRSLKGKSKEMPPSSSSSKPARPNKAARASFARDTINNRIPHILKYNDQARLAIKKAELIYYAPATAPDSKPHPISGDAVDPAASASSDLKNSDGSNSKQALPNVSKSAVEAKPQTPNITVIQSDTYDAVAAIIKSKPRAKIAALNMASAHNRGGGVVNGAIAQEESLCLRSTLYHTLDDKFYRIPEKAALYSPDVLVFRDSDNEDMPKSEWYYTNVISCAAIKNPDVIGHETKGLVYEWQDDYEKMIMKVRLIIQIAKEKGITHLVLGALGCGAYNNPPLEVAKIFKKVLLGDRKRAGVTGIEEIVFAIFDDGENLRVFKDTFDEL